LTCEERLRDQGWFSQEEGWLQGHSTAFLASTEGDGGKRCS